MKYRSLFIFSCIAILCQQCAKQTSPSGGPKDEVPPKLVKSNPANNELNFKGTQLELQFDEFVQLFNPREQIFITPTIGKKFEAIAKKNKVILKFNSKLQDTTTYSINFRESIQDITEKNESPVKIAFSTGPFIDSLSISGSVKETLSDNFADNWTVAVAPSSDTFNIFKHSASWITLTDKLGKFTLENLKPARYLVYAINDKNKNLIVDSKTEQYGFNSQVVYLTQRVDSLRLKTSKLDIAKLKLISARPTFSYYNIRVSKSLVDYKIIPSDSSRKIYSALDPDQVTLKIFNTIPDLDSLQIRFVATDSLNSKIDSLLYLKFQQKKATKDKFISKIESVNHFESNTTLSATITFSKPVIEFLYDSVFVQQDSVTRINFSKQDLSWNESLTKLTLTKKVALPKQDESKAKAPRGDTSKKPDNKFNQLQLGKGAAISVEGDSSIVLLTPVKIILAKDYGVISTKVTSKENFILQLMANDKLIAEVKNISIHNFENLPAGTYSLRLLVDLNKNGKWDAGSFNDKRQPEPVIYYSNPKGGKDIILKANWFVGALLITY